MFQLIQSEGSFPDDLRPLSRRLEYSRAPGMPLSPAVRASGTGPARRPTGCRMAGLYHVPMLACIQVLERREEPVWPQVELNARSCDAELDRCSGE